jgi:DNA mismatch endonuclease, patch repair protein
LIVRRLTHALGFRFRLHVRDLPGNPDLVFPRLGKIIDVRGCFWHLHGCERCRVLVFGA